MANPIEQLEVERNKTLWLVCGFCTTSAINVLIFLILESDLGLALSAIALLFCGVGGCFWLGLLGVNRWSKFNYAWFTIGNCVGWTFLATIFTILGFNFESLLVASLSLSLMSVSLLGEKYTERKQNV